MFLKVSDNLPKRLPKEPIYIHVEIEDSISLCLLTGKFNFHSIRSNAAVFVRDGGKLESLDPHPYYLVHYNKAWFIQGGKYFEDEDAGGWLKLSTKGCFSTN